MATTTSEENLSTVILWEIVENLDCYTDDLGVLGRNDKQKHWNWSNEYGNTKNFYVKVSVYDDGHIQVDMMHKLGKDTNTTVYDVGYVWNIYDIQDPKTSIEGICEYVNCLLRNNQEEVEELSDNIEWHGYDQYGECQVCMGISSPNNPIYNPEVRTNESKD
jgi:hypothetical protein